MNSRTGNPVHKRGEYSIGRAFLPVHYPKRSSRRERVMRPTKANFVVATLARAWEFSAFPHRLATVATVLSSALRVSVLQALFPVVLVLIIALVQWSSPSYAQQRNAILHWRNGDSLPGKFLESQGDQIRWKAPVFVDDLNINMSVLDSVVFPRSMDNVSQNSGGAFRVTTTSGDVFTADLIGADNETLKMANRQFGDFTIARGAIYSLSRRNNPNMIFDGSQFEDWEIKTTDLWQREPAGHANTQKTGSTLFHKANLPKRFELEVELKASAAPKFVLAIAKDERAAAANQTLRLETWDDQIVLLQDQVFEPIMTLGKDQRDVRLRIAYDGETGELRVHDASGRPLATAKNAQAATGDSGIFVRNRGKDLTIQRLIISRQGKGRPQHHLDDKRPRVYLLDGSVMYGSLFIDEGGTSVLNGEDQREIDLIQVDRIETPGVTLALSSDASEMRYADGAVLRGQVQRTSPSHVTLRTAFSEIPVPCAVTGASSLNFRRTGTPARPGQLDGQAPGRAGVPVLHASHLDRMRFETGSLHGLLIFDSANSPLSWNLPGADRTLRLSTGGSAFIERSARNANKEGLSFDPETFSHVLHLRNGEVIPCEVLSCDKESLEFKSPFLQTRTMKSSHLKAIDLNIETLITRASKLTTDQKKLERALTVPRFNRESPPSHIFVANNGDLKRGSLLVIKGQTVQFESKLRKSSVPIDRIARIVNVSQTAPGRTGTLARPNQLDGQAQGRAKVPVLQGVRFKLADGSILMFEPVKATNGQVTGRSVIYGDVSIPIVNIVELQIGDIQHDGFAPLFADWVVRPSKEPQFGKAP